jgi:ribosomal protein S18 acetylase RimI-like enzyme
MIRTINVNDIEEIKEIDKLCFRSNYKRRTEGLRGFIEASNNSSLVYEIDNKVVGFNFIHIWGSFGWFGPLGVHPEYQGRGIGKALIKETIKSLKDDYKVSAIGLNTMPESPNNVGFYMSLDFVPHKLSLSLKKQLDFSNEILLSKNYDVNEININNESDYLILKDNLKLISNDIFDNFDLTSELQLIKDEAFGTAFTLKSGTKINGIVICYTKSIRENDSKDLNIKLAVIDRNADYEEAIDSIIYACAYYTKSIKYESISIDCNTYSTEICNYLISEHNFNIERTQIMMSMGVDNPFRSNNAILFTRLAV